MKPIRMRLAAFLVVCFCQIVLRLILHRFRSAEIGPIKVFFRRSFLSGCFALFSGRYDLTCRQSIATARETSLSEPPKGVQKGEVK